MCANEGQELLRWLKAMNKTRSSLQQLFFKTYLSGVSYIRALWLKFVLCYISFLWENEKINLPFLTASPTDLQTRVSRLTSLPTSCCDHKRLHSQQRVLRSSTVGLLLWWTPNTQWTHCSQESRFLPLLLASLMSWKGGLSPRAQAGPIKITASVYISQGCFPRPVAEGDTCVWPCPRPYALLLPGSRAAQFSNSLCKALRGLDGS